MSLEHLQQPGVIAELNSSVNDDFLNEPGIDPVGYTWELMDDGSWELIPFY